LFAIQGIVTVTYMYIQNIWNTGKYQ